MCPLAFFKGFMSNSGVHTESRTIHFIWTPVVDGSNSAKQELVKVLRYSKYSLLV